MDFHDLIVWAEERPTKSPPSDSEALVLSYAVPFRIGDHEGEKAARHLAVAYMRSALEFLLAQHGSLYWVRRLQEDTSAVETAPDNFWRYVTRAGWANYRVVCRLSAEASLGAEASRTLEGSNAS